MISPLYVIRDRKSAIYGTPFVAPNDSCAEREFVAFCSQPSNTYIAEDLELYRVGTVDNETGVILGEEKPVFMRNFNERSIAT